MEDCKKVVKEGKAGSKEGWRGKQGEGGEEEGWKDARGGRKEKNKMERGDAAEGKRGMQKQ